MQWLWFVLLMLFILVLLAKTQAPAKYWAVGAGSLLLLTAIWNIFSLGLWFILCVITGLAFAVVFASAWRKKYITKPLFHYMQKTLPQMSATEQEALAAGNTWWDAELFAGNPDWDILHHTSYPQLSVEEQHYMDNEVQTLCAMLDDWDITHKHNDLPPEVWQFIREQRFFALIIPKKYGGLEFSAFAHSEVVQKVASRSLTAAVTIMVPNSLGPAELLLSYGSKTQKDYYLPRLASAEDIPCFALTAPSAGSDAGAIPDVGIVCREDFEGKKTLGFRINWEKRYITLGPVATLLGLAFHAYDPDGLLGEQEDLGISCALIPTDTTGVSIGRRHYPLNAAFMNGPNSGHDVFVPMRWLIGGKKNIGKGWIMLVERLSVGRGISLPALSVGAAKHACSTTYAYAHIRQQFRLPIAKFEGVEEVLARMIGNTYMMDAGRRLTLAALDQGERPAVITAMMKYHLTEAMRDIINDAMDIHGGRGICMGPSNYLARMYQSIPVGITVEGANILTRTLIVFGQGSMRCHPFVQQELQLLAQKDDPDTITAFDQLLLQHVHHVITNQARSMLGALSGGWLTSSPRSGETAIYYKQLNRFSAAFSSLSDIALLMLGGALKRKEKLSGRFADALANMYLCSATLWRFEHEGQQSSHAPMMHWACQQALFEVQRALAGIIREFPRHNLIFKLAHIKMRAVVFPWGEQLQPPSDDLGHMLVTACADEAVQAQLNQGIYQDTDPAGITGRLSHALQLVKQASVIEQRLKAGDFVWKVGLKTYTQWLEHCYQQGQLNQEEKTCLMDTAQAVQRVIQVDDFPASD
ncbi:MAG: acyl-CoA dehydrogenase [Mariprofundaceae bacterium]|nr:acyl-CoA dehydrogenase [Mariprofundaceae bacterium]